jgi:stage V sporulation protein D (sporulation-specific penicillin-binding protein)
MANETSGRRDNRVPFRASTKTPNIMMLRRTRFLLIVCGILAFAVLGIKLFNVMIVHHDEYEKMAIDQQVRTTEITASRGAIYDTNGKILAMNAPFRKKVPLPMQSSSARPRSSRTKKIRS